MLPRRVKPNLVQEVKSQINVTPLVDVCLVLLIIFMVVTPMLQKGIDVALPETKVPEKMPENSKQLTISVKQDGSVFVSQNWVPDSQVAGTLKGIHDQTPDKAVVLKGDRRLKYKKVREVMKLINEAGFSRVGLVVEKVKTGTSV
ncbi:MAG TPA: ExbD/TolR family protein [Thermoanaerobaculia bacterium]|nr:ExbD/TolR family protein [Thermoanaerobaculia bacterium]